MNNKDSYSNSIGIICLFIGLGILVSMFRFVGSNDIWFDELFSVKLAELPFKQMIELASQDVHPPLYYIYVRCIYLFISIFDKNIGIVTAAKIAPIIPYFCMVIYSILFVRKRFGWISAGIFVLLVELMPQMSQYMVESRMYSISMFVIVAMFLHVMEAAAGVQFIFNTSSDISYEYMCLHIWSFCFGKKKIPGVGKMYAHLLAAMLYAIAAMYLHYFAFIAACAVGFCLLVYICICSYLERKKIKAWILANDKEDHPVMIRPQISSVCAVIVFCLIAYVPWEGILLSQVGAVKQNYWIPPVSIKTFAGCIKYIFKPEFESSIFSYLVAVLLIIIICLMGICSARTLKNNKSEESRWKAFFVISAFGVLTLLVLVGVIASIAIRPVFVYRYMLPAMGVFWLGIAVIIADGLKRIISAVSLELSLKNISLIAAALLIVAAFCMVFVRDYHMFIWEENKKEQGMKAANEAITLVNNNYSQDKLVCNFNQVQAILWNYLDNDSILWGETEETLIAEICGRNPLVMTEDIAELKQYAGKEFLFIGSGNAREDIINSWENEGMAVEMIADSCLIERYYFNIYHVMWE